MARLLDRITQPTSVPEERGGLVQLYETWSSNLEPQSTSFASYVNDAYKSDGVVFGAILARMMLLSEVQFRYRNPDTKEYGDIPQILERPWANGTTGELVARMEQDASLSGNAYVYNAIPGKQVQRLNPEWVSIVSNGDELIGYVYKPPGGAQQFLSANEVAHWSPIPDPAGVFAGMSWLTPVAQEILSDKEMTRHKRLFFKNAATPNMLIKVAGKLNPEVKDSIKADLALRYEGVENAYRTLLLEGGADATILGANLRQLEFSVTQAAGENRIAVASGVPAIVIGLKEGLQAATYSNYQQAMRRFGDLTGRPLWRSMSASLETIAPPPSGQRLWYDTSDVAALRNDEKDIAEIKNKDALTLESLIRAGFKADTALDAVVTGNFSGMVHTGLSSVQLQPPMEDEDNEPTEGAE